MDVRSIANALIDAVCRGEAHIAPGVMLRFKPLAELRPDFCAGKRGENGLYTEPAILEHRLEVGASIIPSSPAWAVLDDIAKGVPLEIGGHKIRLHHAGPFPCIKVLGPLTAVREDDALALTWDPPFRPTIDLRLLPDVMDPAIHSIRLFRSFAVINGWQWKKSIGL